MKSLVALTGQVGARDDLVELGELDMGGVPVRFALMETERPSFDPEDPAQADRVLVQATVVSCNFRDKSILVENVSGKEQHGRPFVPFGSEFCGPVVACGTRVTGLSVGDRVMGNCAYPAAPAEGVRPGVATNFASLGWLRLHAAKLIRVPQEMDDVQAASFAIGAQTAAGMIRRSGLLERVGVPVIFSSRSVTSLFLAQQLAALGFAPDCLTTSEWTDAERSAIPQARVIRHAPGDPPRSLYARCTHAFDPFFDTNLEAATRLLQTEGTYVTCGLRDQHPRLSDGTPETAGVAVRSALALSVVKNLTIKGNCLGTSDDLERALNVFRINRQGPVIDRIYTPEEGLDFVRRSFFDRARFGKTSLRLSTTPC